MAQGSEGVANDHFEEAPQGPEPDSCSEIPMAPANLRSPASDGRVIARGIKNAAAEGFCLMSSPPRGKVHMATDIAH